MPPATQLDAPYAKLVYRARSAALALAWTADMYQACQDTARAVPGKPSA